GQRGHGREGAHRAGEPGRARLRRRRAPPAAHAVHPGQPDRRLLRAQAVRPLCPAHRKGAAGRILLLRIITTTKRRREAHQDPQPVIAAVTIRSRRRGSRIQPQVRHHVVMRGAVPLPRGARVLRDQARGAGADPVGRAGAVRDGERRRELHQPGVRGHGHDPVRRDGAVAPGVDHAREHHGARLRRADLRGRPGRAGRPVRGRRRRGQDGPERRVRRRPAVLPQARRVRRREPAVPHRAEPRSHRRPLVEGREGEVRKEAVGRATGWGHVKDHV
ncbi:hypothetical protein CLAIMM_05592 isoform 1, partial [Cladophialophora immunda]